MEHTQEDIDIAIKATKACRVELDAALQNVKALSPSTPEATLATRRIQEGIMWLGMHLKTLGAAYPYPNSYNPSNATVDPTADNLKL